ncbi:LysR family transcriptional regulator [Mycolicibacterium mucogenicum]|uniref:LysR family transcriptional regulator n=1 Tax=Mycolicibacterium mucogenicum TaxID=56689 RepID=A0A1A3HBJ8_MYCMU|nr:SDR family oxidoreductase [Mycolicibacterium mucogenicum]OBJ45420.1 LysR family transcriptional regulator [Mycolicibacterium mucogenicum]
MKVTVIGASGLIGTLLVDLLTREGEDVVAASRRSGVDVLSGAGLAKALTGAEALVDVTNSPSFADDEVMDFFVRSTTNLVAAAQTAGVGHYVALSIVGVDELPGSGYMRAKVAQERIIEASGLPYTIVRATQFHEFATAIVESMVVETDTDEGDQHDVRVPDALIQPIAADEVAAYLAEVAIEPPRNHVINIGGPEKIPFSRLAREVLALHHDDQRVVVDPHAKYFGTTLKKDSLVTGAGAMIASIPF